MILTKDELLRRLSEIGEELEGMRALMHGVTETLRPIDDLDTDTWATVEYAQTQLDALAGKVGSLHRDALSDL